jgi:adenosylhomocysteine nucleosidase
MVAGLYHGRKMSYHSREVEESVSRLAYFAPTQMELGAVLRRFNEERRWENEPLWMATGKLFGREAVVVRTGIGPDNAARATKRVLEAFCLDEILLAGFSGGAAPGLRPADLIACETVVDGRDETRHESTVASNKPLIDRALATGLVKAVCSAVTVGGVVTSARDKLTLGTRYGVGLVEMEGFPLLQLAREQGIPSLMVRAVLDGSDEDLPDSTDWLNESGRVRLRALLAYLAVRPKAVFSLVKFYGRARTCLDSLGRFAEAYLL